MAVRRSHLVTIAPRIGGVRFMPASGSRNSIWRCNTSPSIRLHLFHKKARSNMDPAVCAADAGLDCLNKALRPRSVVKRKRELA